MQRRGRLRNRIIAWSFIPTSLVLLAVALVILRSYQQVTEDLVLGRNRELTRLAAGQLATSLTAYTDLLTDLAETPEIRQGDPVAQSRALQQAENRLVVFDAGVVLLDQQGIVSVTQTALGQLTGEDWSNLESFHQLLRTMAPAFSDIYSVATYSEGAFAAAAPIQNEQGGFGGAVVGMFRLGATTFSAFYGGIVKLRLAEDSNTAVIDSNGRLIFHPDPAEIGRYLPERWITEQVLLGQVDALRAEDLHGRDILASFSPIPGTPWGLVTEESWDAVMASSRSYTTFLLLLLGVGLALPALVVSLGVARLTKPITDLTQVAKQVAQGDFGHTVEVHTGDELEVLANQINDMAAQLQASYTKLEQRVELRTRELSTLLEAMQAASSSLEFDEVLRRVARGLADSVGVSHCEIYLLDEGRQLLLPSPGQCGSLPQADGTAETRELQPIDPARDGFARQILETRSAAVCLDAVTDPRTDKQMVQRLGVKSMLGVPLVVKDRVLAVALISTFDTPRMFAPDEIKLATAIANTVGLVIDNARLYRAEQARRDEAERRRRVAEGLREVLGVLNEQQSLSETLTFIVRQSCQLADCQAAAILQPRGQNGPLEFGSSCGLDPEMTAALRVPIGEGIAGRAVVERQPILVTDIVRTIGPPRQERGWPSETDWAVVQRFAAQFQTVLALPLIARDEVFGALALYYRERRDFSDEDIRLAQSVANQAALAIQSARLREQAARSATTAERSRLARELHDSVTQSLYSVTLYGEAAARLIGAGKADDASNHLRELRDTAQEALREMRLLIFQLRPPALEKSGLIGALQARLEAVELRGGTDAELTVEHPELVDCAPLPIQEEVYHIAQEAMNNVLRHARAQHVWLYLTLSESRLTLGVRDDGQGFVPLTADASGGMGLPGMRERAERIGAKLDIESAPGEGARITLQVPLLQPHHPDGSTANP